MEKRIYSAHIVTPSGLISGEVIVQGEIITAIEPRSGPSSNALDWSGDWIVPGLVDIHTDNLEKHYQPRPGALWDAYGAALAHDGQCASAGITTVLDSLSLHGRKEGLDRKEALGPMIGGMDRAQSDGALRAEHLLHLRCEVTNPDLLSLLEPHADNTRLKLLSVMDHTPGQRQTSDVAKLVSRLVAAGHSEAEIEDITATRHEGRDPDGQVGPLSDVVAQCQRCQKHDRDQQQTGPRWPARHLPLAHRRALTIKFLPFPISSARRNHSLAAMSRALRRSRT